MKSYIPPDTAAIFFLANLFFSNRVLARSMSWLISFAWANSGCKEQKPRFTKWKILAHSGTRTHDPWFSSLVPYPLGHQVWSGNDNLMRESVLVLSCIPSCNHMIWVSFCCLTNRYWSNSKMTSISYNYNTEYTTKWKHYLAWYDVVISYSTLSFKLLFPDFPRIFHFVILGFRSLQPEFAHANEINHDILRANTLF